jgi:wyosine [tRNA(Phe)-imidazoG37] synthetase (radical SAM superfamily)
MHTIQEEFAEIKTGGKDSTIEGPLEKHLDTLRSRLENRPLVLYGAAQLGRKALGLCRERGIDVAAFCDRTATDQYEGVEIIDPETLKNRFPDAIVVICSYSYCIEIYDVLRQLGFPTERIVISWHAMQFGIQIRGQEYPACPVRGLKYRSCSMIENFSLNFAGRIDTDTPCIRICCEWLENVLKIAFCESARNSVENFRRMRAELIAESIRFELLGDASKPRKFTAGCAECANFQVGDFGKFDGLIHEVNLSPYPAPCQCKCVYCSIVGEKEFMRLNKRLHAAYYEKMFDAIDYAESAGYIAPDAKWFVSSGEITIHPYKKRILELVKNRNVTFFTNGFLFDEGIASILSENPCSDIIISIDSGTPETWLKIKGVDNFGTVIGNLTKYRDHSRHGGRQIWLKYIVLPGINDTLADYKPLIEIMNILDTKRLSISRDINKKYTSNAKARDSLIRAAGLLVATLHKNGMGAGIDMLEYQPSEQAQIIAFAHILNGHS